MEELWREGKRGGKREKEHLLLEAKRVKLFHVHVFLKRNISMKLFNCTHSFYVVHLLHSGWEIRISPITLLMVFYYIGLLKC